MPQRLATTTRLEEAVADLRRRHERVTPARLAVLTVLTGTEQHLNAEEVIALAAEHVPTVHRATVYRALATLGELGLVAHVHLGGSSTVYHATAVVPAAHEPGQHAHVQCTRCGMVMDIPASTLAPVGSALSERYQFRLDPGHTALLGTCHRCSTTDDKDA